MEVRVLAHGTRGGNQVSLLMVAELGMPALFVVTMQVFERGHQRQTWARTDFDPLVARELYDVAVAEFISGDA